jgi:DNA-binding NarL/FixJ family response regulator
MRARLLLGQALDLLQVLGMTCKARRACERLRGLPRQPGADDLVYRAGLSVREVQVLRLVAGGMSNRRIAKELALSENTVANHLTSIFKKTGADNRASATAFAVRHSLA